MELALLLGPSHQIPPFLSPLAIARLSTRGYITYLAPSLSVTRPINCSAKWWKLGGGLGARLAQPHHEATFISAGFEEENRS